MTMRTYDALALSICSFALLFVFFSPILWLWRLGLLCLIVGVAWAEWRAFRVQMITRRGGVVFIRENNMEYAAELKPSSVIGRYLCFLCLSALETDKCWRIPVSRLEFSAQAFKQLKRDLQQLAFKR